MQGQLHFQLSMDKCLVDRNNYPRPEYLRVSGFRQHHRRHSAWRCLASIMLVVVAGRDQQMRFASCSLVVHEIDRPGEVDGVLVELCGL